MKTEFALLRADTGFTQDQVAKLLSVHPTTVWRWENGQVKPSASTMIALKAMAGQQVKGAA